MASFIPPILKSQFITISILIISILTFPATGENSGLIETTDADTFLLKKEKVSHFRLYWHDIVTGRSPTAVTIVPPINGSTSAFGTIRMIDDPLTVGPTLSSKLVGRAQGFYSATSQQKIVLLMAMNFAFIDGKYNGSTITILGRNSVFSPVREMPVIGGSGLFRWARGYAQAKTYKVNMTTGDAIVEYNIYVMHY